MMLSEGHLKIHWNATLSMAWRKALALSAALKIKLKMI